MGPSHAGEMKIVLVN